MADLSRQRSRTYHRHSVVVVGVALLVSSCKSPEWPVLRMRESGSPIPLSDVIGQLCGDDAKSVDNKGGGKIYLCAGRSFALPIPDVQVLLAHFGRWLDWNDRSITRVDDLAYLGCEGMCTRAGMDCFVVVYPTTEGGYLGDAKVLLSSISSELPIEVCCVATSHSSTIVVCCPSFEAAVYVYERLFCLVPVLTFGPGSTTVTSSDLRCSPLELRR